MKQLTIDKTCEVQPYGASTKVILGATTQGKSACPDPHPRDSSKDWWRLGRDSKLIGRTVYISSPEVRELPTLFYFS